jgi:hypothetical protein
MTLPRVELTSLRAFLGATACQKTTSVTVNLGLYKLQGGLTTHDIAVRDVVNAAIDELDTFSAPAGTAATTTFDPTGLVNVTDNDVQGAIEELDAAIAAGGIPTSSPVYTRSDQTGTLPNSRYLFGGDCITFTTGATDTEVGVTSGSITDGFINAAAAIAGTKIAPDFGAQNVTTTGDIISTGAGASHTARYVGAVGVGAGTSGYNYVEDNDGSVGAGSQVFEVDTTDATTTTLKELSNSVGAGIRVISSIVTATKTDGSSGFSVGITGTYKVAAGVNTLVGSIVTSLAASGDACAATYDISGGLVRIRVTGIIATNYQWGALVSETFRAAGFASNV